MKRVVFLSHFCNNKPNFLTGGISAQELDFYIFLQLQLFGENVIKKINKIFLAHHKAAKKYRHIFLRVQIFFLFLFIQ